MRKTIFTPLFIGFISFILLSSCNSAPKQDTAGSAADREEIRSLARPIVKEAFQMLSSNLVQALEEGGVPYALEFCNVEALPLTDSVARKHNIRIRRITDRNRNPENAADAKQAELMEYLRNLMAQGTEPGDTVIISNNGVDYYAPIFIGAPCLQCHGTPSQTIMPENLEIIRTLYPADKATGYSQGELRGLWYLHFEK